MRRVVVRLYEGHSPLTVTEETTEDFAKQMLEGGQRQFLETALREFEQATGEKLLPGDAAQTSDRHVIEAFSRVAVATLYGKSQAKDGPLPSWRGAMKGKLAGMVKALGAFLRAVFRRAMAIEEARTSGKLDGLALPDLIDQALGLDAQTRYDRAVAAEAAGMVKSFSIAKEPARGRFAHDYEADSSPAKILRDLRASEGADASQRRKPGRPIASVSGVVAWAEARGKTTDPEIFTSQEQLSSGGEHIVFFNPKTGRVAKLTKPGMAGAQGDDAGAYLERWDWHNRTFGDDVRIEGVVQLPGEADFRLVISQPFVAGRDATVEETGGALAERGFVEASSGRWVHPVRGLAVWDVQTPGNAIAAEDGSVAVVDLQIGKATAAELAAVRERTGLGGGKSFSTIPAADIPGALTEMFSPFHGDPKARREIGNLMQDRVFQFARQWQAASARLPLVKDLEAEARRRHAEGFERRMAAMDPNLVRALSLTPEDITVAYQPVAFAIINDIGKMMSRGPIPLTPRLRSTSRLNPTRPSPKAISCQASDKSFQGNAGTWLGRYDVFLPGCLVFPPWECPAERAGECGAGGARCAAGSCCAAGDCGSGGRGRLAGRMGGGFPRLRFGDGAVNFAACFN
ncbi:MAG: hypothetical protein KA004_02925 [Verrucomicrobiales bacterium]|nr:hypothetical protein [Verrucomicrobiales bacterium]